MGILEKSAILELDCPGLDKDQLDVMVTECERIKNGLLLLFTEFVYRLPSSDILSEICLQISNLLGLTNSNFYVILEGRWVSTEDINGDLNFKVLDDRIIDFVSLVEAIKIKTKQGDVFPLERYLEISIIFWKITK